MGGTAFPVRTGLPGPMDAAAGGPLAVVDQTDQRSKQPA